MLEPVPRTYENVADDSEFRPEPFNCNNTES